MTPLMHMPVHQLIALLRHGIVHMTTLRLAQV